MKLTLEKLLNEIFYLDKDKNKRLVEQFAEEKDMARGSQKNESCQCLLINNLRLLKIVDLNRHPITFMIWTMQKIKKVHHLLKTIFIY